MQYITTGNRIAVENFVLGDLYTITFTSGTYINSACIGIGENFVSFQRNEPELLFTLTMETAELVSSIDLYAGGTGTNNYADLTNKPQINSVELIGNKTAAQLGLQSAITEESPLSSSLVSGLGSAAAADTSDFATAAQGTLAASAIQSAGTGLTKDGTSLNHSNSVTAQTSASFSLITFDAQGHITGSTEATAAQLDALNSGVTSTDVAQIETNKTNILSVLDADGAKNALDCNVSTLTPLNTYGSWSSNTYSINSGTTTFVINSDLTITASKSDTGTIRSMTLCNYADGSKLNGKVISGGASNVTIVVQKNGGNYQTYATSAGDGALINGIPSGQAVRVVLSIEANVTCTDVVVKPMLCAESLYNISHKYQPYAMSNAEITAWIIAHS